MTRAGVVCVTCNANVALPVPFVPVVWFAEIVTVYGPGATVLEPFKVKIEVPALVTGLGLRTGDIPAGNPEMERFEPAVATPPTPFTVTVSTW